MECNGITQVEYIFMLGLVPASVSSGMIWISFLIFPIHTQESIKKVYYDKNCNKELLVHIREL